MRSSSLAWVPASRCHRVGGARGSLVWGNDTPDGGEPRNAASLMGPRIFLAKVGAYLCVCVPAD
jgi:hypothetical protein